MNLSLQILEADGELHYDKIKTVVLVAIAISTIDHYMKHIANYRLLIYHSSDKGYNIASYMLANKVFNEH